MMIAPLNLRAYLHLGITFCCCLSLAAQSASKEGNVWCFGSNIQFDFNPAADFLTFPSAIRTSSGAASICNSDGELLFYTNGGGWAEPTNYPSGGIWNGKHELIYDMQGQEGGSWNSAQSAIFIPAPGRSNHYYLFTMEERNADIDQTPSRGLSYFEIDQMGNGGIGAVVDYQENIFAEVREGIAAYPHANGTDYWLVVYYEAGEQYQFFLIDATGVNLASSTSKPDIGSFNSSNQMHFSPNGEYFYSNGILFDFDAVNAKLSNPISLTSCFDCTQASHLSFSPNSEYLYYYGSGDIAGARIMRISLTTPDLIASLEELERYEDTTTPGRMQVAPNGSIYYLELGSNDDSTHLSEIKCPNSASPCIRRKLFGFESTDPLLRVSGFPSFTNHFFINNHSGIDLNVSILADTNVICSNEVLSLVATIDQGFEVSYLWSNGATEASILINEPGIYSVTVTNDCCNIGTAEFEVFPAQGVLEVEIIGDTLLCEAEHSTLEALAPEADSFLWSTGEVTTEISIQESGTYALTISNACGFVGSDSIEVIFLHEQDPIFEAVVVDNPCYGESNGSISLHFPIGAPNQILQWTDTFGNDLGNEAELLELPAAQYQLAIQSAGEDCILQYDFEVGQNDPLSLQSELLPAFCKEDKTFIELSAQGGSPDYLFRINDSDPYRAENRFFVSPGRYQPSVLDEALCEQRGTEVVIDPMETVLLEIIGPSEAIPMGEPFSLSLESNRSLEAAQITWYPQEPLTCWDCSTVSGQVFESTYFTAVVSFPDDCTLEVRFLVPVDKSRRVYVPNAFSPNGDGENDVLTVYLGEGAERVLQFKVFNRWGALLHDDPEKAWDAWFKGQLLQSGVYAWLAEVEFVDGHHAFYQGDVLIVR